MVGIAYDREESTELEPRYFVYEKEENWIVIYKGTYTQCLVVLGAFTKNPHTSIEEIKNDTNGFI